MCGGAAVAGLASVKQLVTARCRDGGSARPGREYRVPPRTTHAATVTPSRVKGHPDNDNLLGLIPPDFPANQNGGEENVYILPSAAAVSR